MYDTLERSALAVAQAAALVRALGRNVEMPDILGLRETFLAALAATPKAVRPKDQAMLRAVGLRR